MSDKILATRKYPRTGGDKMSENFGYCERCHNIGIIKEGRQVICCTNNVIHSGFSSEKRAKEVLYEKLVKNRFVSEVEREIDLNFKKQIREHVKANELILAMKLYKRVTGFGLVEAKAYIFRLKNKM